MNYIISIVLTSIIIYLIFVLLLNRRDNFIISNSLSYLPLQDFYSFNYIVNTPLTKLKSEIRVQPDIDVSNFFCYNFYNLLEAGNQGIVCGSCWAFVVTGLIGDRMIVEYNGTIKIRLSAQQLLECYDPSKGCDGESPEDIFNWMINTNFVLGKADDIPYNQLDSNKISGICPKLESRFGIQLYKNSVYSIVEYIEPNTKPDPKILKNNILNMKRDLVTNGPFFATIAVYDDLFSFREDRPYINISKNFVGGHAIEIVGYCDPGVDPRDGYTEGYWICKNSWGHNWPINAVFPGYFTIKMGKNICGIESRCGAVQLNLHNIQAKSSKQISFSNFTNYSNNFLRNRY
jgi:hypothetical protein